LLQLVAGLDPPPGGPLVNGNFCLFVLACGLAATCDFVACFLEPCVSPCVLEGYDFAVCFLAPCVSPCFLEPFDFAVCLLA